MKILDMIAVWRRGCKYSPNQVCLSCTLKVINDIEAKLQAEQFTGCVTPRLQEVIEELTHHPPKREDVDALCTNSTVWTHF